MASELVLAKYKDLYQQEYLPRHRQAIGAFGVTRYCELAEFAIKQGKHAGKLMSSLITSEYKRSDNRSRLLSMKANILK